MMNVDNSKDLFDSLHWYCNPGYRQVGSLEPMYEIDLQTKHYKKVMQPHYPFNLVRCLSVASFLRLMKGGDLLRAC